LLAPLNSKGLKIFEKGSILFKFKEGDPALAGLTTLMKNTSGQAQKLGKKGGFAKDSTTYLGNSCQI
jgi:hypothetical protein